MADLDEDIENLLEEVAQSENEEEFLREILHWELERVSLLRRHGKNQAMDEFIEKYVCE